MYQSTVAHDGPPENAFDENTDTHYQHGSCIHTLSSPGEWWRAIFPSEVFIHSVRVFNRFDVNSRFLSNVLVRIVVTESPLTYKLCGTMGDMDGVEVKTIVCQSVVKGVGIEIKSISSLPLHFCEVDVFGIWSIE